MRIAIVHDDLMRRGGAEQVVLCFCKTFPDAPLYTLAYDQTATYPEFKHYKIITSWFQSLAINERVMKWLFFPFGLLAMKQLDVSGYDIVLVSSTYCGKYVKVDRDALVINYCHSPFRLAWYPESYKQYVTSSGLKRKFFDWVVSTLKKIDYRAAQRTDFFIANAKEIARKIKQDYNVKNEIAIINPPVECKNFYLSAGVADYFLVVCRLEYYKRVDIVIDTFNKLNLPLIVVGKGIQEEALKGIANENIIFKKGISNAELAYLYSQCKALIFPQIEDFGITPLEANASGRPVIAYGKGGVLETMIPYDGTSNDFTAIFFLEQTEKALINAVKLLETLNPNPHFIRKHAEKFDEPIFVARIKDYINDRLV